MYNQGKYEMKGMKIYFVIEIMYNRSVLCYTKSVSLFKFLLQKV